MDHDSVGGWQTEGRIRYLVETILVPKWILSPCLATTANRTALTCSVGRFASMEVLRSLDCRQHVQLGHWGSSNSKFVVVGKGHAITSLQVFEIARTSKQSKQRYAYSFPISTSQLKSRTANSMTSREHCHLLL
jgi:hypothetical protein